MKYPTKSLTFHLTFLVALSLIAIAVALRTKPSMASGLRLGFTASINAKASAIASAAANVAPQVKRGPATIVLQEGYSLPVASEKARLANSARPTTLASVDFDMDGYPDLVTGSATSEGGVLSIQRGNPEAFAPTLPENVEAVNAGRFPVSFLPAAQSIELSSAPDFIAVGDFDRDSNPDIVAAARNGNKLYLAAGDGHGNFAAARSLTLPGNVTALVAGQIDLPDSLTDLVVGITGDSGASLLVYESAEGLKDGLADKPVRYALPAAAQTLALGQLDETLWGDLAILADGRVSILHGRNQQDDGESGKQAAARLEPLALPFAAQAMALGQFIWDREGRTELALLREDGSVAFAARGTLDTRPFTVDEARKLRLRQHQGASATQSVPLSLTNWQPNAAQRWSVAESMNAMESAGARKAVASNSPVLFSANLSGQMADDLVVVDAASQKLNVFAVEAPAKQNGEFVSFAGPRARMSVAAPSVPVAALSMRLNLFVRPGLMLLHAGSSAPLMIPAAPSATFTVTKGTDGNDGLCNAADCSLREAIVAANGAAGADMVTVPANTYTLTIANGGGANEDNGANGDLDVNQDLTISGASAATTILQAGTTTANGIDKVFGLNPACATSVSHSWNNVTVRFGRNTQANGLPDVSFTGGGVDYCNTGAGTLSITNSVFSDNTCLNSFGGGLNISTLPAGVGAVTITNTTFNNNKTPSDTFDAKGGGIRANGSGNLTLTGCTISNNQTGTTPNIGSSALGGGMMIDQPTGAIMIHSTTISGNVAQRFGGGVAIDRMDGVATSAVTIDQASVITGNTSNGGDSVGGGGQGGGIYANVNAAGTVTLTGITITNNTAGSTGTPRGGGIASSLGSMNISFCRIVGNTASQATGLFKTNAGGTITATNNWWGCNAGPGSAGCQTTLVTVPSTLTTTPRLNLTHTASPSSINTGATSTLTASFLTNSAGSAIAAANLGAFTGVPITFNNAVRGTLSGAQATIQATGTATATFTANAAGAGSADAIVDNQTVTTSPTINITCPTITGTMGGGGTICAGGSTNVTVTVSGGTGPYTVTLNNSGGGPQMGAGPVFTFPVMPGTTTTYMVASGTDNFGCPITSSGTATVTVTQPPTTSTVGGPQTICNLGTTLGLGGNTPSVGTGAWSIVSGGTGTFSNAATPNATFTHTGGVGPVVLRWTITGTAPCPPSTANVTINITQPPTTATVGGPQTICNLGTTAGLGGNTPSVGTGAWSIVSGGAGTFSNATTPNATFTHTGGVGPVVLRWTITGTAPCPTSTADVTITITQSPTMATAGPDQSVCNLMATLAANNPSSGTGLWTMVSGPGTVTFGTVNSPTSTATASVAGVYTLRWTISNAPCTASMDEVVINFNTPPTLTYAATAGVTVTTSTTINPATGPGGAFPITNVVVQSQGTYTGTISVNNSGVVSISNAAPGGTHTITIRATNSCNLTTDATFALTVSGLQFYPLATPVRLLDTRPTMSLLTCTQPGVPLVGGASLTQLGRGVCTIPTSALALTGNITTVQPAGGGYLTLYPSDVAQPFVASTNFTPNQTINNVFTVALATTGPNAGSFNIYSTANTHVMVDITGYYAPPGAGGLYFHPLPTPIRLLETRPGEVGFTTPGVPLPGDTDTAQVGRGLTYSGVTIPATAQALVGNATTVNPGGGFLTLYPQGVPMRPEVASSTYNVGEIMNGPFTVGLGATGQFMMYVTTSTHLVVDVLGYYSPDAVDANGTGLLFTPLSSPTRLLETRAGEPIGCDRPNAPLLAGSTRTQLARGTCTIPNFAQSIVGNATTVNPGNGYLTFFPSSLAMQPLVATSNFVPGQIINRHFIVGLGGDGAFKIYTLPQTDLVIDVSGYFAP